MSSVWPTVSLTAVYLIVVKVGPSVMNSRQHGFQFRWSLFGFNAALVALNLYIFIEVSTIGVGDGGQGARAPLKFGKNIFRPIIM